MPTNPTRTLPTAVVMDTGPAVLTFDRDPEGRPFTPHTAELRAAELNAAHQEHARTWRAFRLVPNTTPWLVEQISDGHLGEHVDRHGLVYADTPAEALTKFAASVALGGDDRLMAAPGELREVEPGYRWSDNDGSMIWCEVRRLAS